MKITANNIGYFVNDYLPINVVEDFDYISDPYNTTVRKIEELISLNENWDGYGAIPVTSHVGENAKKFLYLLSDSEIEEISDIFPNSHGTLTFEWANNNEEKLSLEIGEKNYSYYVIFSNKKPKLIDGQDIFSNIGEITSEINNVVRK